MKKWKGIIELTALCLAIAASVLGSTFILNHQFSSDELRVRGFYLMQSGYGADRKQCRLYDV